jgi:hypothetical protein
MPPTLPLVILLLAALADAFAASDDAATMRACLIAHAGASAPPSSLLHLMGEEHREVSVVDADALSAHLQGPDVDAVVPWRALDVAALTALSSPFIDRADDQTLAAWLRLAASCPVRELRFGERYDRLRVRAPDLAATVAKAPPAIAAAPPATAIPAAAPDAEPALVDVAATLARSAEDGAVPAPPTIAAWDASLFAKNKAIVRAAYVRACASLEPRDIDHRLGPDWGAFHPNAGKPAKVPASIAASADEGMPEVFLRHQDGEYVWKQKGMKAVDWTGHGGQVLFLPDKAGDPGIDRMTFCWSYHENHGPAQFWHVYLLKPGIDPKDGGQWWSGLPDPCLTSPAFATASGADVVRMATAIGRAEACWANNGIMVFRNGLVTYDGSGNSGDPGKPLILPPGKVPTAVALTNSAEFALITVWDIALIKAQLAVVALKTINWMQPTNGFFSDMKLLGFVDLPNDLRCPTGICAGSDSPFGKEIENADIRDAARRAKLADDPACAATRGFAVVISRSENRACVLDLAPLFQWVRANRLGPAKLFEATEKPGPGPREWPFTFEIAPAARPTVVQTIAITQPTAVMNGYKDGDPGYGSKAVIATMDGTLVLMEVGQLGLASAKAGPIAAVGMLRIGRNPTSFGLGQHNLGPANSFFVCCRGDRSVHWVKAVGNQLVPIKVLRDKRLIDPVAVEPMDARWADVISVADFKGRQVVNYLFRPITPWYQPLFGGLGAQGDADFECSGLTRLPGFPYAVSGAEVP